MKNFLVKLWNAKKGFQFAPNSVSVNQFVIINGMAMKQ